MCSSDLVSDPRAPFIALLDRYKNQVHGTKGTEEGYRQLVNSYKGIKAPDNEYLRNVFKYANKVKFDGDYTSPPFDYEGSKQKNQMPIKRGQYVQSPVMQPGGRVPTLQDSINAYRFPVRGYRLGFGNRYMWESSNPNPVLTFDEYNRIESSNSNNASTYTTVLPSDFRIDGIDPIGIRSGYINGVRNDPEPVYPKPTQQIKPKEQPIQIGKFEGAPLQLNPVNMFNPIPFEKGTYTTRERQPGERFSALYDKEGKKYSAVDIIDKSGKLLGTIDPRTGKLAYKHPVTGEEQFDYGGEVPEAGHGYIVKRSNARKGKTHVVIGPDGTKKYFGDSKLGQHPKDPARKKAFYARHAKNLKNNPYFRAFARKTWAEGGMLPDLMEMAFGGMFQDGGKYLTIDGEAHRVYKNAEGDIMVNHPKEDKGKWDTINLTEKSNAHTIAEGLASVRKWHREHPYAFGGNVILEKYQGGGKWIDPGDAALIKVLMERNRGKNFVDRAFDYPYTPTLQTNTLPGFEQEPESERSSHLMAYDTLPTGEGRVYPTIVEIPNQGLKYLGNGDDAWDYADRTGEYITTPTWHLADVMSDKGYKLAAGIPTYADGGNVWEIVEDDNYSFQKGGKVVSEIWQEVTGTPWREAKKMGLTKGGYDENLKIRAELLKNPEKFASMVREYSGKTGAQPVAKQAVQQAPQQPLSTYKRSNQPRTAPNLAAGNTQTVAPAKTEMSRALPNLPLITNPATSPYFQVAVESTKVTPQRIVNVQREPDIIESAVDTGKRVYNKVYEEVSDKYKKAKPYFENAPWTEPTKLPNYFTSVFDTYQKSQGSNLEEDPIVETPKPIIKQAKTTPNLQNTNTVQQDFAITNTGKWNRSTTYQDPETKKTYSKNVIDMSNGIKVTYQPRNERKNERTNVDNAEFVSDYMYDMDFTDGYQHEHAKNGIEKLRANIGNKNYEQKFVQIRKKQGDNWIVKVIPFADLKKEDLGSIKKEIIQEEPYGAWVKENGKLVPYSEKVHGRNVTRYSKNAINTDNNVYRQSWAKLSDLKISPDNKKVYLYKSTNMFKNQGIPLSGEQTGDPSHVLRLPGGLNRHSGYFNIDDLNQYGTYLGGTVTIVSDDGKIVKRVSGGTGDILKVALDIKNKTGGKEVWFLQSDAGSMNVKSNSNNGRLTPKELQTKNQEDWAGASEILLK